MVAFSISLTVITLLILAALCSSQELLVTVEQGVLRGYVNDSVLGGSYRAFVGIPYAEPPLGNLRFAPPVVASSWEGVKDAVEVAPRCMQTGYGDEDCLYLNVYTPLEAGADQTLLPVLVWIPGGAFANGTGNPSSFGPDFLIVEDIIVVTMNYRVGPFGFLSTEDEVVPGNAGLKDQQLALRWVQNNIAAFGGDPARVTMGGESAGGASSSHHLIAPSSAGLFQQAIIQNGQAVSPWGILQGARDKAFRLGELLGLQTNDSQDLVDFLRSKPASDLLVNDLDVITYEESLQLSRLAWAPVIEPDLEGAVITEDPAELLKSGRFNHVPILTGVTSGEGFLMMSQDSYLSDAAMLLQLNDNFEAAIGPHIHLNTRERRSEAVTQIRQFYFGGQQDVTWDDAQALVDMTTDLHFAEPTDSLVRIVSNLSDQPVYYYLFDYRGANMGNTTYGTPHAQELVILFRRETETPQDFDPTSEEGLLRTDMVRVWANFVKYGTPSPEGESIVWEPFSLTAPNYLYITTEFTLLQNKDQERMDFWHQNIPLFPIPVVQNGGVSLEVLNYSRYNLVITLFTILFTFLQESSF